MTEKERAEICYECGGYGDDYRYDAETDSLVCNCDDCWVNEEEIEDDRERTAY